MREFVDSIRLIIGVLVIPRRCWSPLCSRTAGRQTLRRQSTPVGMRAAAKSAERDRHELTAVVHQFDLSRDARQLEKRKCSLVICPEISMECSRNSINDIWGERTPFEGVGQWPVRMDECV